MASAEVVPQDQTAASIISDSKTEERDGVDLTKPHPLQNNWTLWFDTTANTAIVIGLHNWEDNLQQVATVKTVEDFWSVFNHIAEPTALLANSTYHLFKEGIEPKWEDPQNENGGKLIIFLSKDNADLNEYWLNTALAVIGEAFEEHQSDDICGAVLMIRKQNSRIALWTKSGSDHELQESIKNRWTELIATNGLPENVKIEFGQHDVKKKGHGRSSGYRSNPRN